VGRIVRLMVLCAGLLCLGTILLIAGCGGGGSTQFRMMNAVPDEPSLNVLVDNTSVSSNLAYGTSTGYLSESSGTHQIAIEPSGSSTSLLSQSITLASGSNTTVISSNFSSEVSNLVLTDDNSAPTSGDFKLRIVNESPGLGPADVYVVTPGTALTTVSPTLSNLDFGASTAYQSLAGGDYEIELTSVGQKFAVIDTGSLTLSSGEIRTFVGLNSPQGGFSYTVLHDVN
jgi:hypothetical protein